MATLTEDYIGGRGGLGFGGGDSGIGIIALLALLGGRGFGNNDCGKDRDCVDTATLQASLNSVQDNIGNTAILGKLGAIEAAVPYNEAQMQLALAGAVSQLSNQANTNTMNVIAGQNTAALAAQTQFALVARDICNVDTNVDRQSTAIQVAIRDDGERTRALIVANTIAELQAEKVILANALTELRGDHRAERDRHGVEVTMINNQNQNQLQFQQQSQVLNSLSHGLIDALQTIRSTNSAINIGGTQLASPTNTNSNVRA